MLPLNLIIISWFTILHWEFLYEFIVRRFSYLVPFLSLSIFTSKLNPSKLDKNEDVTLNLAHLLNILSELVEKIFMAAEILPP